MGEQRPSWVWTAMAAVALMFATAVPSPAQSRFNDQPQYNNAVTPFERVQELSRQLEVQAADARDRAKLDENRGGRDEVTEEIEDFAKHAHELRLLAHEGGVPSSRLNESIRQLVDDGRKVQKEWAKAKRRNPETEAAWNRTLATLNNLNDQFMAANGLAVPRPVATSGSTSDRDYVGTSWSDRRRLFLSDLDRRSLDAVRLSQRTYPDSTGELQSLRDQVILFNRQANDLAPADARDRITHMLSDARDLQRRLSDDQVPIQLRDNMAAIVGTLVQMRDMAMDRDVAGTSGIGTSAAIDTDRYASMSPVELWDELNARTAQSAALAGYADVDDVSSEIARFRDELREFNEKSATMDRGDRRDALDHLLRDAQDAQRDLARRHVSADLVNQWNAVVDLLVRLRDAS